MSCLTEEMVGLGWTLQALGFLFHNNFEELSVISGEIRCRSKISRAFSEVFSLGSCGSFKD